MFTDAHDRGRKYRRRATSSARPKVFSKPEVFWNLMPGHNSRGFKSVASFLPREAQSPLECDAEPLTPADANR